MTIVLTGATGFLGSHLLRHLLHAGHSVVALKRRTSDLWRVKDLAGSEGLAWLDADGDPDAIWRRFAQGDLDAVIHCATEYGRGRMPIADVLMANLLFPIRLLDLCKEFGVRTFLNTDSYFNKPSLSYPYLLDYSLSKKSLLLWLPYFADTLQVANLTLEHVYGPQDGPAKFVVQMVDQIAVRRVPSVKLSPGDQLRDFVYVSDAVSAYLAVLEALSARPGAGLHEFNVGTGAAVSIREFVESVKRLSGSPTELAFGALPYRDREIMLSKADTRTLAALGWRPRVSLQEGISAILRSQA